MYQAVLINSYCADLQIHIEVTGLCQSDVELRSLVKTPNMNTAFSGSGQKCVQRNSTVVSDFIFQPCPARTSSEQCQQDARLMLDAHLAMNTCCSAMVSSEWLTGMEGVRKVI